MVMEMVMEMVVVMGFMKKVHKIGFGDGDWDGDGASLQFKSLIQNELF